MVLSSYVTPGPYFERTVRTSSKSLNGRKIARMAPILTIFGPNRSRRRDLFFEKFSNERRRHRRLVVVSSSPSSSPSSPPSSPQHNYSRSQLPRTTISPYACSQAPSFLQAMLMANFFLDFFLLKFYLFISILFFILV